MRFPGVRAWLLLSAMASLLLLAACEAGLGSKVDVTAPKVAITSPAKTGEYHSGVLTITGTATDDLGVTSVVVSWVGSSGELSVPATLTGSDWSVDLSTSTAKALEEGQNILTVVASDASGKTATDSRLVYMDNVPPTVLVTYPLSHGPDDSLLPRFTDTIDLKGEVYDQSPISAVTVTLLDGAGTTLESKTADGTNTWSVRFALLNALPLADGTTYYYQVQTTDAARLTNAWYYSSNDIYGLLPANTPFPTVTELGKLDAAGAGQSASGIQYSALATKRLATGSGAQFGDFKFLAVSVPNVQFSNMDAVGTASTNVLSPGSIITGNIIPPSNTGAVDLTSLRVKVYTQAGYPNTVLNDFTDAAAAGYAANLKLTSLGESLGFSVALKDGTNASGGATIPPGTYYITVAAKSSGSQTGTQVSVFTIDSEAPTLTETFVGNTTKYVNAPFQLTGTAFSGLPLVGIAIEESRDGNPKVDAPTISASGGSFPNSQWTSSSLPVGGSLTDGTYSYRLVLSTASKTTTVYRTLVFDRTAPGVEITSLTPLVGANKVNGSVNFTAIASDGNGLGGVRYWIQPTATAQPAYSSTPTGTFTSTPYGGTIDTLALTDNTAYTVWVQAQDKANNTGFGKFDFLVDQSSDLASFALTTLDASVTSQTYSVAKSNLLENGAKVLATVTDDDGVNVSTLQAQVDGGSWVAVTTKPASNSRSVTFSHDVSALASGVHTTALRVNDVNGLLSTLPALSFVIDKSPPQLGIDATTGWSNNAITLTGTASDDNDSASATPVSMVVKDEFGTTKSTISASAGTWATASIALPSGTYANAAHTWSVTATDSVGKTSTQSVTFTIDRVAPVFTASDVSNLAAGDVVKSTSEATPANLLILGVATDPLSGIQKVEYSVDGGTNWLTATGTNTWSVSLTGLGNNLSSAIEFRATDKAGNVSTPFSIPFQVDLADPTFTESTSTIPSASVVYKNANVVFGGNASDGNLLASVVVTASKNGAAATSLLNSTNPANGTWTATLPVSAGDGSYELTFTATDKSGPPGRTTSFTRNVVVDTSAPDLTVTNPVASELVATTSYVLRGQVTDNGGKGVASLEYSRNNSTWTAITLAGLNWSTLGLDFSSPVGAETAQGARTVYFRATDGLNGYATVTRTFNYDTEDPLLGETTSGLTTSLVNRKTAVNFGGTASDTNALATVKVSLNGAAAVAVTGTSAWSYSLPATTDGTFALQFIATDAAGRTATVTRNVLIDTTVPTLPVFSTTPGAYVTSSLSVAGTTGDGSGSGVQTMSYRLDGVALGVATGTLTGTDNWFGTVDVSGLAEGSHTVTVWATDRAGNLSAEAAQTFVVDRFDPLVASAAASTQSIKVNSTLTGTSSDANGLASVTATLLKNGVAQSAPTVTGTTSWSISVPVAAGDGTYVYTVVSTDSVGRTATLSRTVIIDTTAPTVVISSPAPGDVVSTSNITVAGTASDGTGSGVASVEYSLDNTNWFALNGGTNWNKAISLGSEGAKTLYVRASDGVGLVSTPVSVAFNLDQSPPSLTETGVGAATARVNASFTLTGAAGDTNGLQTWDDDSNSGTPAVPYVEVTYNATPYKVTVVGGTWSYPFTVATDGSQDGNLSFTVTATDVVGKPTTLTRNVVIDTTKPTLTVDGILAGLNVTTSQVNGLMTFRFSGDDAGVGLEKSGSNYQGYYKIVASGVVPASSAADVVTWTSVTSASSVFSFNFDTTTLADGTYDLYLAIRDAVPGSTPNTKSLKVTPALVINQNSDRPLIGFDNLNVAASANFDNGLGKNPTILLTIQDDDKVKVSDLEYRIDLNNDGNYDLQRDFWSGNAVLGADNDVPNGVTTDKWENEATWYPVEVKPASDGSLVQAKIQLTGFPQGVFGLQVRARDNQDAGSWSTIYGVTSNYSWQQSGSVLFSVDFGPPSIKVTAPLSGTYRSNLSLSGTTKDLLGVARVKYSFDGVNYTVVYSNSNPIPAISPTALVTGLTYKITALGNTNWTALGAGVSPSVGTSFAATGAGTGTGLAIIDPSVDIPFSGTVDISALGTGEYTLQVVSTDVGGSDATQQVPITIDKDTPSVSYLQPGASETLNGLAVKVSGEASDNRKVGAVFLWHGLVTAPDPALPAQTSIPSVANPNGLYSAGGYTLLVGTGIWNTTIDTTAVYQSGANGYRIRVVAVDAIGNVGTPLERLVTVDQNSDKPVVGFSNLNTSSSSRLPAGNVTIIGTVSDDDAVAHSTIQIRLDRNGDGDYLDTGEGWVNISNPPPSDSVVVSWSHEITDMTSQGNRHVQVRVKDVSSQANYPAPDYTSGYGWSESDSIAFFIDNGPPTLNLASPTIGQKFKTGQFTLSGDTNDTNGIQKVNVWVDDNDNQTRDAGEETWLTGPNVAATAMLNSYTYTIKTVGTTDFTLYGAPNNNVGTTFVATGPGLGNGVLQDSPLTYDETSYPITATITSFSNATKSVKAVQVTSYDISGASTTRDLSIVYDPTAPTATVNTPTDTATVNGNLFVSGLASDNYQLTNVYYALSPAAAAAPAFPAGYSALNQSYSWNFTYDTTALADGAYTLRVVATDTAGNDSSASPALVHVTVDQTSDRPVLHVLTLSEAGSAVENLLPASLQISGTVADDDSVDKTKLQVRTRVLPAGSFGAWSSVSGPPAANVSLATFSHTFTGFTDGQYEVQLRAADTNDTLAVTALQNGATYTILTAGTTNFTLVGAADSNVGTTFTATGPGTGTGTVGWRTFSTGTSATIKFAVDLNLPAGTIAAPAQGAAKNADVAISGSATDASGVKKVTIAYDTGSGYGAEKVLFSDTNAADGYATPVAWNDTYLVTGSNDGQTFYRVTITDAFDKVRTYEQYFTVDTTAPTNSFLVPASGATVNGSVEVRGNSSDTNQMAGVYYKVNNNTGPGTWATGVPTANGWTLLSGTYNWTQRFKSTTLADGAAKVYLLAIDAAGNRSDPTLAANQLALTVDQATNLPVITLTTANNALLDNTGAVTGTITDDDGVDTSTLQISFDSGSTWRAVSNPGANGPNVSFSHAVAAGAGLTERAAAYGVVVRVSDLGETFVDTSQNIAAVTTTSSSIQIKKDDSAPSGAVSTLDNGLGAVATLQGAYISSQVTLTGTASDGVGVSTVEARLVGVGAFAAVTNTGTNYSTWSWAQTGLSLSGSSVNLEVRVTDVNGRQTVQSYTLLIDTTLPTTSFDSAALNPDTSTGTYNGTVTFRGGAADNVLISKVYTKFAAADPGAPNASFAGWTLAAGTYSWTAALDTATVNNTVVDQAHKLWVVSVDGAGNVSTRQSLSFTINQGSDKPVITLSAPTAAQVFDVSAKALGTVTDDDGLTTVEVRIDRNNDGDFADANEGYVPVSLPASISGKSINLEHVLSTLADGDYKLQIHATDSLFTSTGATPFNEASTAVLSFSIDTAPPTLTLSQITVPDRYAVAADRLITSNFNGSHVNNDLTLQLTATDAAGITSVQVQVDRNGDGDFADAGEAYAAATLNGVTGKYDFALALDLAGHSLDGTRNIQYLATDGHGKTTTGLVTLIVDTVEPVISFTSPVLTTTIGADAPNVNGTVNVLGSVTDSSAVSSLVASGGLTRVSMNPGVNLLSWKVTFASGTYANATDSTSQGSNIWRFPLEAIATDIAGNKSQAANSTGYLDIDPDSDKPIVTLAAPSFSAPATYASVSGSFLVSGSVTDDDGAQSALLQIDFNDDGLYANVGLPAGTGLDLNNDGDKADDFESEAVAKTISVTNGAWSILLNQLSELNKTNLIARGFASANGFLRLKVTPVDINGLQGSPQTIRLYIDSTAPTILGLATDGVTPSANPTPATGSLQRGTLTIRALFKDDQSIPNTSMQVSLDGGNNFSDITSISGATISADVGSGNPYTYRIAIPIDTKTAVTGGNGDLQVSLKLTDQTFKQTTSSLTYHVDNTLPSLAFNTANSVFGAGLSYQGTPPAETYSFYGGTNSVSVPANNGTANEVLGQASDAGTISGIDHINVYFVKGTNFVRPSTPGGTLATASYLSTSGTELYNQAGTLATGIPFTEDPNYAITIDKRTELGQFDANTSLGDGDGFQESLKAKSGSNGAYDEWYSYFDTTVLPDGPLTVYFVAYDQAGNKRFGTVAGQVTNYPPSLPVVTVNGSNLSGSPWKVKTGAAASSPMTVVLTANDTGASANIASTGWRLDVVGRYGNGADVSASADTTYSGWYYGTSGVRDFSAKGSGSTLPVTATVSIYVNGGGTGQESSFTNGYWYLLRGTATDADGNIATQDFFLKINNSDNTAPTVTFPELSQTAVADWTAKTPLSLDVPTAALTAASANISAALPGWITAGTKVMWANGNAPGGFSPGTVYYVISNANPFQLSATNGGAAIAVTSVATATNYTLVSGGHVEAKADSAYDQTTADADVSGGLRLSGTAADDTDVKAVGVQINGVGASLTVTGGSSTLAATANGLTNGTPIYFTASAMPAGLTAGTTYYVVSAATNSFAVSTTVNGTAITPTTGGTSVQFWLQAVAVQQPGGSVTTGYSYTWSLVWDSSRIATVAAANVTLKVNAVDLAGNATNADLGTAGTVDVVPYITSITDPTGLPATILRGSNGGYSITSSATNKLTAYGYNLGRTSFQATAWSGSTVAAYATGVPNANTANSGALTLDATYPTNTVQVTKNWTRSGYLTLVVNSVPSGNNLDNNANANNSEATGAVTAAKWNDNRFLWVWNTKQVAVTSLTTTAVNPALMTYSNAEMIVNPTNDQPEFAFDDDNGGILVYNTSDTAATRKSGYRKMGQAGFATATIGGVYQRFFVSAFDSMVGNGDNTGLLEIGRAHV